jgi:predicted nucleotidyltransferase
MIGMGQPPVRDALRDFRRRLEQAYGQKLAGVLLFGSFARGDEHEESDVDVLVLFADDVAWDEQEPLFRAAAEVSRSYRLWVSPLACSCARFRRMTEDEVGIALAIQAEGIEV